MPKIFTIAQSLLLAVMITSCSTTHLKILMDKGARQVDGSQLFSMSVASQSDTINFGTAHIYHGTLCFMGSGGDSLRMEIWTPFPRPSDSTKLLLFIPGLGENALSLYPLAIAATRKGFTAALLTPRGIDINASAPADFALFETQDAANALEAYKAKHSLPKFVVGVFGASLGGVCALNLGATQNEVSAVVLESTMLDPRITAKKELSANEDKSFETLVHGHEALADSLSPINALKRYPLSKPLFCIWGEKDRIVSIDEQEKFKSMVESQRIDATFQEVTLGGHTLRYGFPLSARAANELNESIIAFMSNGARP